jgi:hypothetical protein
MQDRGEEKENFEVSRPINHVFMTLCALQINAAWGHYSLMLQYDPRRI